MEEIIAVRSFDPCLRYENGTIIVNAFRIVFQDKQTIIREERRSVPNYLLQMHETGMVKGGPQARVLDQWCNMDFAPQIDVICECRRKDFAIEYLKNISWIPEKGYEGGLVDGNIRSAPTA